MRSAVRIALHRDGRNGNDRGRGEEGFNFSESGLTVRQAEAPPVIAHHYRDVVGILESRGRAFEGRLAEAPARRRKLPDEACEVAPVAFVAEAPALGREVELVPPGELGRRRERR